ncbi:cation channel family transporter (macronuclear) [Tetrahymena thermophila SB210]|uniref:Cation channel family transporter n=1 Tax=Tetrahymena thermophila (strain SB210) TaxID=312017 RepID=W7X413_TETTS|nr:cation channel family transporter [Tetrahymena thermophila SB210]EWS71163.1 cation channel family transporter [Tetrahymena thermophila SB210]|eukprot:XP_012656304.1 cation channel family transporter [Tetrahymena thermophila SB210]
MIPVKYHLFNQYQIEINQHSYLKKQSQPKKICILLFNIISLLFLLILTPLALCFDLQINICSLCSLYLLLNLLIQTNLAYFKGGELVSERNLIAKRYFSQFSSWVDVILLLITVIACFYYELRYLSIFIILKFNDVIYYYDKVVELFEINQKYQQYTVFLRIVIMILLLAHISGCIFILIGQQSKYNQSWLTKFQNQGDIDIYVASIFWSIITMITIGYGDIVPQSTNERVYVIFVAFVSCGVFAYSINTIGETVREKKRNEEEYNKKIVQLQLFMKQRSITRELRDQIFRHYSFLLKQKSSNDQTGLQIIGQMPESIKQTVQIELYYTLIKSQQYFSQTFDSKFLYNLCSLVKEIQLGAGMEVDETVFPSKESFNESLLFVIQGDVGFSFSQKVSSGHYSGQRYKRGEVINLELFVTGQQPSIVPKFKTFSATNLAYLERSSFLQLLNDFPEEKEKFFLSQDKVSFFKLKNILNLNCKSCGKLYHYSYECPYIHKIMNRDQIIYKTNISTYQERDASHQRKRSKDFSAFKYLMVELSPDCNAQVKEQSTNKLITQIGGATLLEQSIANQIGIQTGTIIVTQPQVNDLLSNQLICSQKNGFNQNNIGHQDITSLLQPYSVSDVNIQISHIKPSLQSLKKIELLQKSKQRLNNLNQRALGSQGLIQPQSDLVFNSQNYKQKLQNQEPEVYYDSSLDTSEMHLQQPMHINSLAPFHQYFHEEDLYTYQSLPSSIDHQLVTQKSSITQNVSQNQKLPARNITYIQKVPQSPYKQNAYDEAKLFFGETYSQNFSSFSNQYISQKNTEEFKGNEQNTMGKIYSDLSVSIKPESLRQSISKKNPQNSVNVGQKQNSFKTFMTGGILKQLENRQENSMKKQTSLANQIYHTYQNLYQILDEKCFEIDVQKNFLIYFPQCNYDTVIKKYNMKNMKNQKKPLLKARAYSFNKKDQISKQQQLQHRPSFIQTSTNKQKELSILNK